MLVFLLFYFYEGLIFFSAFFRFACFRLHSLYCAFRFSQSSAGSALFSPREFYDPPTGRRDTRLLSGAGKDGATGKTENLERVVDSCVCCFKTFPKASGDGYS